MKRIFRAVFALLLAGVLFAGCQNDKGTTITMLLYSPELQAQYNNMAAAYFAETGISMDIQVIQADYRAVLASRINSGDAPDVFMSSAYADNITYKDISYDLSGQGFIQYISPAALEGVTLDGMITGYPFLVQTHSFI